MIRPDHSVAGIGMTASATLAVTDVRFIDKSVRDAEADYGGAVHVASGTIKVRNSNFRNNSAVTSDAIRHHISSYTLSTGSAAANAKKNYWNNPTVASDANLNGVNTLNQLSAKVNFEFDPPAVAPPCGVRSRQVCSPTPTVTQAPPTLESYGIILMHDQAGGLTWSAVEETNILTAANHISHVFALLETVGSTDTDKFKIVMGDALTFLRLADIEPYNSDYTFYYDVFDENPPTTGRCQVFDPTAIINTIVIACRGQILQTNTWITNGAVTVELAIHELGHVLDICSGLQLRSIVNSPSFTLSDCPVSDQYPQGERVMGWSVDWQRGQRGWGSTSPISNTEQEVSRFQQNPIDQESRIESMADMFLNWVYRRTSDLAPTGLAPDFDPTTHDTPAPSDACSYFPTGQWEGFANTLRDGNPDSRLPGNARYWWMEGTMSFIFSDKGWK